MELHESLYALGRSQGRELFNDADSFRGALDDYLDEDSASTGDINLLVDAVRLGAFQSMMTMIDSGADSDRAVAEAGSRLARDRGSADVGGAMWALAVLGYAIGKVSDSQVRRYRTQHASSPAPPPAGPPTVLPPSGPAGSPPGQPYTSPAGQPFTAPTPSGTPGGVPSSPVWPSSGPTPGTPSSGGAPAGSGGPSGQVPPAHGQAASFGQTPPGSYGGYGSQAAPPKKRKTWPIVVAVVAVLAVIVGVGIAVLVAGGGDDDSADPKEDKSDEGPDVSFEAVDERYAGLGEMVTSGMDECVAGEAGSGEEEQVECTFPDGTLVLTTYSADADLKAARKRRINDAEGTIVSTVESGAYYRLDPTTADENSTAPPVIYWDSLAGLQSAELTGGEGVTADKLDTAFKATSATVTPPDGPVDTAVIDFNTLFDVANCVRIPTEVDGETEESKCKRSGRNTWVGQFTKAIDLRRYRENAKTLTEQDDDLVVDYWYNDDNRNGEQDEDEPEQGKIYGYIEDGDTAYGVLYIDDLDCRCYLQMYDKGEGDPQKLYNLIF